MTASQQQGDGKRSSVFGGVILGAVVSLISSFATLTYTNSVQDRRTKRAERAVHIERTMNASSAVSISEQRFTANWGNLLIQYRKNAVQDVNLLIPDPSPVNEMRTITALYLPEVEAEANAVVQDYSDYINYELTQFQGAAKSASSDDVFAQTELEAEKKGQQTRKDINLLQEKLIKLAKEL